MHSHEIACTLYKYRVIRYVIVCAHKTLMMHELPGAELKRS